MDGVCITGRTTGGPLCGNGQVDPGEECDLGRNDNNFLPDHCRPDCRNPRCGDGILDRNEQCDDSNLVAGDKCDRFCRIEATGIAIDLPGNPLTGDVTSHPPAGKTGPAAIGIMAAGAAAGWSWMRRKRRK